MIRFSCSYCQTPFEVDGSMAGRTVDCSQCQTPITIPNPDFQAYSQEDEAARQSGGNLDIRLRDQQDYAAAPASEGIPSWAIYVVIIVVINLFLLPLTGWALIPR